MFNDSGFVLMLLLNVSILMKIDFLVGELIRLWRKDVDIKKFFFLLKIIILKKNRLSEEDYGKSLILLFLVLLLK